jgi:FtsH-binding integral membrane protein
MRKNYNEDPISRKVSGTFVNATLDEGLRSYMVNVYAYMSFGVLLTGLVSFFMSQSKPLMQAIFGSPLVYVIMLAPFGLVWYLAARINTMKYQTARLLFWVYSALIGLSLSSIFLAYTGTSIARVFFISSSVFGTMSLYGYTTKKDLTSWGSFLFMGLIGLVIASLVNLFLQSTAMQFILSIIGVLIFTGLTAYDTQKIKESYDESDSLEIAKKKSVMGALSLYMDFINIFIYLLRFFGERKE